MCIVCWWLVLWFDNACVRVPRNVLKFVWKCTGSIKLTWLDLHEGNTKMAFTLERNREFFLVTAWRPRLQTSSRWRHRHFDTCTRFVSWILQPFRASIIMSREFYVPCTPYAYQVSELSLVIFRGNRTVTQCVR